MAASGTRAVAALIACACVAAWALARHHRRSDFSLNIGRLASGVVRVTVNILERAGGGLRASTWEEMVRHLNQAKITVADTTKAINSIPADAINPVTRADMLSRVNKYQAAVNMTSKERIAGTSSIIGRFSGSSADDLAKLADDILVANPKVARDGLAPDMLKKIEGMFNVKTSASGKAKVQEFYTKLGLTPEGLPHEGGAAQFIKAFKDDLLLIGVDLLMWPLIAKLLGGGAKDAAANPESSKPSGSISTATVLLWGAAGLVCACMCCFLLCVAYMSSRSSSSL